MECGKLLTLVRNLSIHKALPLQEMLKFEDKDNLGLLSRNKLGFLLENKVGLDTRQIDTLLGMFDPFKFGFVKLKDFCLCVQNPDLLKEVACKNSNQLDRCRQQVLMT